jgi:hypothetical protein
MMVFMTSLVQDQKLFHITCTDRLGADGYYSWFRVIHIQNFHFLYAVLGPSQITFGCGCAFLRIYS